MSSSVNNNFRDVYTFAVGRFNDIYLSFGLVLTACPMRTENNFILWNYFRYWKRTYADTVTFSFYTECAEHIITIEHNTMRC